MAMSMLWPRHRVFWVFRVRMLGLGLSYVQLNSCGRAFCSNDCSYFAFFLPRVQPVCSSVLLSACLSACQCLSVSVCQRLSICLSVSVSICQRLSVCLSVKRLSASVCQRLPVSLSVCLTVCLIVCLSVLRRTAPCPPLLHPWSSPLCLYCSTPPPTLSLTPCLSGPEPLSPRCASFSS